MSVPLTPLRDYIVAVKEKKSELKTRSGLLIAPTVSDEDTSLKVVAIGQNVQQIAVGDRIIVKTYSETSAKLEFAGDQYQIIKEDDVLATVKQETSNG